MITPEIEEMIDPLLRELANASGYEATANVLRVALSVAHEIGWYAGQNQGYLEGKNGGL